MLQWVQEGQRFCSGILHSLEKGGNPGIFHVGEPQPHHAEQTNSEKDKACIAQLMCENFQKDIKPTEVESRTIVGRGWGLGRGG